VTELKLERVVLDWREPFFWKSAAVTLGLVLVPMSLFLAQHQGAWGLAVLVVAAWPRRPCVALTQTDFTLRWRFVEQTFSLSQITSARIVKDPRRAAFWRSNVLRVDRPGAGPLLLFGGKPQLRELARALSAHSRPEVAPPPALDQSASP
jgi:hypothetical protein